MDFIKTLAYAGLGLAAETNDKLKEKFEALVESGRKADSEGKNLVGDFFKTVDSTKEDFESEFNKNKGKLEEKFPIIKELEDKFNKTKEDVTTKFNDTKAEVTEKAKSAKEDFTSKVKEAKEDITKKVDNLTNSNKEANAAE